MHQGDVRRQRYTMKNFYDVIYEHLFWNRMYVTYIVIVFISFSNNLYFKNIFGPLRKLSYLPSCTLIWYMNKTILKEKGIENKSNFDMGNKSCKILNQFRSFSILRWHIWWHFCPCGLSENMGKTRVTWRNLIFYHICIRRTLTYTCKNK